jgi:hypothetical protein
MYIAQPNHDSSFFYTPMKSPFLLLFVAVSFLYSCNENQASDSTAKEPVKPKILKSETKTCEGNCIASAKEVINYNDKGEKTEELKMQADGTISSKTVYVYNADGKPIEVKNYSSDMNTPSSRRVLQYGESGMLLRETNYTGTGTDSAVETIYNYDSSGKLLSENYTQSFTHKREYLYGSNGKVQGEKSYNTDGSKDDVKYTYDDRGNVLEEVTTLFPEKEETKRTLKYDNHNQVIEVISVEPDGSIRKFTTKYTYNEEGQWITQENYYHEAPTSEGTLTTKITRVFEYN